MHGPFRLFFFPIPVSGGARSSLYSIRRIPSVSSSSPLPSSERLPASVFSAHRSPLLSSFINRFCGADALALLCCVLSPPDCSRLCRDTTPILRQLSAQMRGLVRPLSAPISAASAAPAPHHVQAQAARHLPPWPSCLADRAVSTPCSHGLTGHCRRDRTTVQVGACCLNLSHYAQHLVTQPRSGVCSLVMPPPGCCSIVYTLQ